MRKLTSRTYAWDWVEFAGKQQILAEGGHGPTEVIEAAEILVGALGADLLRRDLFGSSRSSNIQ